MAESGGLKFVRVILYNIIQPSSSAALRGKFAFYIIIILMTLIRR